MPVALRCNKAWLARQYSLGSSPGRKERDGTAYPVTRMWGLILLTFAGTKVDNAAKGEGLLSATVAKGKDSQGNPSERW